MTSLVATVRESEADTRWRNWQRRGTERDRRTAARMRNMMLLIVAALGVWYIVQLA